MKLRILAFLLALSMGGSSAYAQGSTTLRTISEHGTVDSTSDSVILRTDNLGGFGSIMIQTLDSYTGTWEVQCAVDEALTWDTDNELGMTILDVPGTVVYSVSDTVGIWNVLNASGCRAVKIAPTAGFSGTDTTFWIRATQSGGSGGGAGGGGGSFDGVLLDAPGGDAVTDTVNDAIRVNVVQGGGTGGTSLADDGDFTPGTTDTTPIAGLYEVSPTACTAGDVCTVGITSGRAMLVSTGTVTVTATNLDIQSGGADLATSTQAGNIVTSVQLIDDAVYVDDADFTDDTSKGIVAFGLYQSTPQTITDGDVGPLQVDSNGRLLVTVDGTATVSGIVDTELGTAVTIDNDIAIPTVPLVGAILMCATAGVDVDICVNSDKTEDVAESGADTGPLMIGVRRDAAASSSGTSGDFSTINLDSLGQLWTRQLDPCTGVARTTLPISYAADTAIISASASNRNYICGGLIVAGGSAEVVNIWEGTGSACGTNSAAIIGSTTEANGVSLVANEGFIIPNTIRGIGTNVDTCIRLSSTNRVSGYITYVQAP